MMCLGNDDGPNYCNYIHKLMDKDISIYYNNIFKPIRTNDFLNQVYEDEFEDFKNDLSNKYPLLFYTNGMIIRDGRGLIKEIFRDAGVQGKSWNDRIELHKSINRSWGDYVNLYNIQLS